VLHYIFFPKKSNDHKAGMIKFDNLGKSKLINFAFISTKAENQRQSKLVGPK